MLDSVLFAVTSCKAKLLHKLNTERFLNMHDHVSFSLLCVKLLLLLFLILIKFLIIMK